MPVIDMLATIENHRSSHRGTCFEAESPVTFDTAPTNAVTKKWHPVNIIAVKIEIFSRILGQDILQQYMRKNVDTHKKLPRMKVHMKMMVKLMQLESKSNKIF